MKIQMLQINLSNRSFEIKDIPHEIIKKYLGGRGLGAYLLYNFIPAETNPLSEHNHIIFTAGPANGTNLFFSSKVNCSTKSPLTGIYLYSISSGILGHNMRKAGLWAIDIRGIASSPTYIVIHNQSVEFRDATPLWGMETAEAQRSMLGGLSPKKAVTVAIGPAGEQLIGYAAIFSEGSLYRCFGRGGAGCVMGSKKLKGMVVIGDGTVEIADKIRFDAVRRGITKTLKTDLGKWVELWRRYETAENLKAMNDAGVIPTRNWQTGSFDGSQRIGKATAPMGWPEKNNRSCGPYCPVGGCREVVVQEGIYKGARSDIEWETIYAFGSQCGVDKMEAIIAASQICDEFGIDTMTAGITIGFAMECFEKGLIGLGDTEGIELRFGNDEAMIAMLKKLAKREGFGIKLAKGTKKLCEEIKGSEAFAMHSKGLELGGYECRGLNGQALQYAVNNRGGCHHAYGLIALSEIQAGTRCNIEGKGDTIKNGAINRIVSDSLPVCTFLSSVPTGKSALELETIAEVTTAILGDLWSVDDLEEVGLRTMCQERLFNMREGITRKDDSLPIRLLNEPKPDGPTKGVIVPLEELKDDFYRSMGYDLSTGNPPDSLLVKLKIKK